MTFYELSNFELAREYAYLVSKDTYVETKWIRVSIQTMKDIVYAWK